MKRQRPLRPNIESYRDQAEFNQEYQSLRETDKLAERLSRQEWREFDKYVPPDSEIYEEGVEYERAESWTTY